MDYERIYHALIDRARDRFLHQYSERHHVIPRCMGGSDELVNLVRLTPEEHFVAHQLLVKMYPKERKLKFALQAMLMDTGNQKRKNKAYGWLRRLVSENMRTNNPNAGGKARRAYIEKHGRPPVHNQYRLSDEGRKNLTKCGSDNPNYGVKAWLHPRQTDESRSVWKRADELYLWWLATQGSYMRMSKTFGYSNHSCFMNVVKYFKSGWIPHEDVDWIKFKETRND